MDEDDAEEVAASEVSAAADIGVGPGAAAEALSAVLESAAAVTAGGAFDAGFTAGCNDVRANRPITARPAQPAA